ncbi:sporulation protein [Luteimonas yindakuii]|uniref:SPOR domain-containing protein n=1 Tax=Luteimonas yindakuii TaxID=2565782 RepID=UPI0010A3C90D|nr:SPOR domain-containing protein [Luteimonas yindakuii]QCO68180.1 sporulation protein [Luteimonas yindakuii]
MDSGVKQRLIGAAVLVALAVIFLPMLVKGPAPASGRSELSLELPDAPAGAVVTRDLPLMAPVPADDSAVLPAAVAEPTTPAAGDGELPTVDTAAVDRSDAPTPARADAALPATAAGGAYAVHFGSYGSSVNADTVVNRLVAAGFPAASSEAAAAGKPVWRVRIGPYATRAEAEIVRVGAAEVGTNDARVIALDADAGTPRAAVAATPAAPAAQPSRNRPAPRQDTPPAVAAQPVPAPPVATPAPAAAAGTGFVVQLGAFRNAAEANAMRDRLRGLGFSAFTDTVQSDRGQLTRVKAGPVIDRAEADRLRTQIQGRAGIDGIVRPHP